MSEATELMPLAEAGHLVGALLRAHGVAEADLPAATQLVLRAEILQGIGFATLDEALAAEGDSVLREGPATLAHGLATAREDGAGLAAKGPLTGLPLALALPELASGAPVACLVAANPSDRAALSALSLPGAEGALRLEHVGEGPSRAHTRLAAVAGGEPEGLVEALQDSSRMEGAEQGDAFELIVELLADLAEPGDVVDLPSDRLLLLCFALSDAAHWPVMESAVMDRVIERRAAVENGHLALRLPDEAEEALAAARDIGVPVHPALLDRLRARL